MSALEIYVSGKVQGVWFRANTRKKALELGLNGTVENIPDGRVHIIVSGEDEKLALFTSWCHQGEPPAIVEKVEINKKPGQMLDGFSIIQ